MAKKPAAGRLKSSARDRAKALKADFDAVHQAGKQALMDRDFDRLARVIERERQLIEQQRSQIDTKRLRSRKK